MYRSRCWLVFLLLSSTGFDLLARDAVLSHDILRSLHVFNQRFKTKTKTKQEKKQTNKKKPQLIWCTSTSIGSSAHFPILNAELCSIFSFFCQRLCLFHRKRKSKRERERERKKFPSPPPSTPPHPHTHTKERDRENRELEVLTCRKWKFKNLI